jgi:hypothetical protein
MPQAFALERRQLIGARKRQNHPADDDERPVVVETEDSPSARFVLSVAFNPKRGDTAKTEETANAVAKSK